MNNSLRQLGLGLMLSLLLTDAASSQQLSQPEQTIERLADIQLSITDKSAAEAALAVLLQEAVTYRDANPTLADAWIATARVRAVYASLQGMSALPMAKEIKAEFEQALALDAGAQQGTAQGYLGQVYLQVPGWPLSFGDDKKGVQLLQATLASHPDNALINLFYAQHLVAKEKYTEAEEHVRRASEVINADAAHPKYQQMQQQRIADLQKVIADQL